MDRITPKEVLSMMQAVAQVYEQPEAEQLDEIVRNLRPGETIKQYDERKAREAEAAAKNRDKIVPDRGAYDDLTKAQQDGAAKRKEVEDQIYRDGGGDAKVKELQAKGYTLGQARRATMNQGRTNQRKAKPSSQSTTSGMTPAQVKAAQDAANQARRDGKTSDIRGGGGNVTKPTDTEPTDTKPTDTNTKPTDTKPTDTNTKPTDTKPTTASDPNVTKDGTKFERRMPTSAELRAAQQARRDAPKVLSRDEIENRAVKAGVGVAKGTVKDPKIAADANRKAELERIRQRAALQTRAGVRPTVASTADSKSRTAAGIMSNKSASGSGPGGYKLSVDARPKSAVGRVASNLANSDAKPAATSSSTPAVKAPASAAASPAGAGAGSVASRLAAIRAAKSATTQPSTAKSAPVPSTTGATTTPTVKPVATTPTAQVRGREAMMARQKNPRNRNTQLNQGDPMERMTGKGAASLMETYSKVYEEREPQAIDEGIMGALKKVGKAVLGPADQSPEAEAARMGKRRPYVQQRKRDAAAAAIEKLKTQGESYDANADLFDIIKGHFIEEGLTEEEAFAKMFDLTDEERTEIIEGSCGSKKKSKKKGGY